MPKPRVLVVEDNPDLVNLMTVVFGASADVTAINEEFESIPASVWAEADIALIDFMLPAIDGCELAQQARAANPGLRIYLWSAAGAVPCADRFPVLPKSLPVEEMLTILELG